MEDISIKGFGACAPELAVSNYDLSKLVETSNEWIEDRTGIKERRISQGEDTSEIATKAAKMAMERAGMSGEDIDLIIVATITPDMFTPSVACLVQKGIGAKGAMAFDISAACSGFIYGLQIAYSMMESNNSFKNVIVIGAEILSKIIDWTDRSTCVLFGDGSGAVVLTRTDEPKKKMVSFYSKSDGSKGDALTAAAVDVINPFVKDVVTKKKTVEMNGQEVFKFAVTSIVSGIKTVLEDSNLTIDDIDFIVPHQANLRIIEFAAKKLKMDFSKFYVNLDRYGNTSSATIPMALNEMYEKSLLTKGKKIIMVGFGGGLTFGAALIEL
jgi:3-oxoacyl-[acyl-carrier-protein] synthase-3